MAEKNDNRPEMVGDSVRKRRARRARTTVREDLYDQGPPLVGN